MDTNILADAVASVTKTWANQIKREERSASAALGRGHLWEEGPAHWTIRHAAFYVMEDAYNKASSNGQYPAHARQIYYAARPEILSLTGKDSLGSNYFTQDLLPAYMEAHPETTAGWNVAFDAWGHLVEPHTEKNIALGTLQVREYMGDIAALDVGVKLELKDSDYPTCGPVDRYRAILFIEKEGFLPLFTQVKLAERYDIAIMSTKGMSVTACRELVDRTCGVHGIPLLVVHDFDKSGFSILGTLTRDSRRYRFNNPVEVIDLGLRLEDVEANDLGSEPVSYGSDPWPNLRKNGATNDEIKFLSGNGRLGQRVELNAFTSEALVAWLEKKLQQHGIGKLVPDTATLEQAYRRAVEIGHINTAIEEISEKAKQQAGEAELPADLRDLVRAKIADDPGISWDQAIAQVVAEQQL